MILNASLRQLWQARRFIRNSVRNEFITRVVRSRLGLLWVVLLPLAQVALYAFVLSQVMAARLPGLNDTYAYPIYLSAGILAWTLFSEVFSRCLTVFIENGNLLKKMVFPRLALPAIVCGSALLNNLLLFLSILGVFAVLGHYPDIHLLWLPLLTALLLALAVVLGLGLGVLNVFFRDIGQVSGIVLQFAFWLTPVVYSMEVIDAKYHPWLQLNPLTGIVQGYQAVLVYGRTPDFALLAYPLGFTVVALLLACFLYRRAIDEVVDVL